MRAHVIIDYTFLYYKYTFQLIKGLMPKLTCDIKQKDGTVENRDISQVYYSLREIEKFRKSMESVDGEIVFSVCFDMPGSRSHLNSETASQYKANRKSVLNSTDFENMYLVEDILRNAGYNTYRVPEREADDVIYALNHKFSSQFDKTIVITPDIDLAQLIDEKTYLNRYKSKTGYTIIGFNNFDIVGTELKCDIPYNAVTMYKSTVGDTSDHIPGIKKFGAKAFEKMVQNIAGKIDWASCVNPEYVREVMNSELIKGYLGEDKWTQAIDCMELVLPQHIDSELISSPDSIPTSEKSKEYLKYSMISLVW